MTPPFRAAIYTRFSTTLQTEKSTNDQIALCRTYAEGNGYVVAKAYSDEAKSGASTIGRDGFNAMLADAMAGEFDVIVVEALDRLSRDMADMAGMFKRLEFMGIRLAEVHGGEANSLIVGIKAIVAQQYLADLKPKIRRGMQGLIRDGKTAGGRAYGYTPDPVHRGTPMIVPEEAEIVLRIFQDYHDGKSPKAICRDLNAEGIRAPRGKLWAPSALYGFASRGTGILRNLIYKGVIVWNKVRMDKHPDTGKRVSRPNPKNEWLHQDAPELEIVPPALFDAVQAQLETRSMAGTSKNLGAQNRPKLLLSGLIKCAACGSGMAVYGHDKSGRKRIRCSAHTNSGSCPNPQTFYLGEVEALVIDTLADELATTEQVNRYARAWLEGRHKEAAKDVARRAKAETRMKAIGKELDRITTMMIKGLGDERALDAASKELGAERGRLQAELDREPPASNIVIHPTAVAAFAKSLTISRDYLHSAKAKRELNLYNLHDRGDLHQLVREVVASVTLSRDEDGRMCAEVRTWLDHFAANEGRPPLGAVAMVAEEGLEPPTRGL